MTHKGLHRGGTNVFIQESQPRDRTDRNTRIELSIANKALLVKTTANLPNQTRSELLRISLNIRLLIAY